MAFLTSNFFLAQKRMTWSMIIKQDEFNAIKSACSYKKTKIIQDFEKIKTKVNKKYNVNTYLK